MDYKKDLVLLSITLAGGEIEETAKNAGVSTVASLPFSQQPATSRLKSTDIEDIMTGKKVSVTGESQGDTFALMVSGSPKDLEIGLQLAHALLTSGKIEQSAFDNWKQESLQRFDQMSKMPQFRAIEALIDVVSGSDPRRTMMNPAKINDQSVERSQAWLERVCREAPIEVAVVGEMKLEDVMPLVEKYVGSLPKRERSAAPLDKLRKLARKPGPLERHIEVETVTPMTMVLCGFMGSQATDIHDVRALNLARLTLDSRLIKRIREELGLVYSIGANNVPSDTYDDSGIFISGAPCTPGKGEEVAKEVDAIFKAFADTGPTAEEMENAKKQIANELDSSLKEPNFWFDKLQKKGYQLHLVEYKNDEELNDLEFKKSVFDWMETTAGNWRASVAQGQKTWKGKFKKGVKDFFAI